MEFPHRSNSLNFLRLVLAVCVIVSHAWPLGGFGPDPHIGSLTLGGFAVAGFFAISGWLITQSRLSSELPAYAWRRFLRIYPAFWVSQIVVAFVFAPLSVALGGGPYSLYGGLRYFALDSTLRMKAYAVNGGPRNVPYVSVWNGSLWTLFHEAACYLIVGLLVTLVTRRWAGVGIVGMFLAFSAASVVLQRGALPGDLGDFLGLAPFFFGGAALFVVREYIPLRTSAAAMAAVWLGLVVVFRLDVVAAALPLSYLSLWLGARLPLAGVGRRNDISYGMYVYAFPVQQLLVLGGATSLGLAPFVIFSIAGTVPLAIASWVAVERPALRLKALGDRFPLVRTGWRVSARASS